MKKFSFVLFFLALGLMAQTATTPPVRTYPDVVTSQTNASIALTQYKSNIEGYISQDGTDIWNLQRVIGAPTTGLLDRMTVAETALKTVIAPTPSVPVAEYLLVIPYGSTGFSTISLGTQIEYPPTQRTRRLVDFTNVHQIRSCTNIISPAGAGSNFFIRQSPTATFTTLATISGPYDLTFTGLHCSTWQPYGGPTGDQFIRVEASGSGSVTLDFISMQVR